MAKAEKLALIFGSVHNTLEAEQCLNSAPWSFLLIPVPPKINQGCGLAIQIDPKDEQDIAIFLQEHDIVVAKAVMMD